MEPESIARSLTAFALLLLLAASAEPQTGGSTAASTTRPGWRDAPAHLALFVPRTYAGRYRAYVSDLPLDALLRTFDGDTALLRVPGAWVAHPVNPLDALGRSGPYDRLQLARLYRGSTVQLARGPRSAEGSAIESWSLISPYPDPTLHHLEPGTLILVLTVP